MRSVGHIDADCFFASVEEAYDKRLRGKAVAVGGASRGVIASPNYEARRHGVKTAMPTARAKKLCPHLIVVPGDFDKYERFSRLMFSYVYDFTPVVQVSSIDEGYFDLSGARGKDPMEMAATIRRAIREGLRINVSEGLASNKLVASIASKVKKPAAFVEVPHGTERDFLAPLANNWLPGVGLKMAAVLDGAGLATVRQIAAIQPVQLSLFAGSGARQLWEFANGVDERPVVSEPPEAKSYSEQETFDKDTTDEAWILAKLKSMADRLMPKAREEGKSIRTVAVKIRYEDFTDCSRSESLPEPTDLEADVYPLLARLLKKAWERRVSLRLVSLKISGVYKTCFQESLGLSFGTADRSRLSKAALAIDSLRSQFGSSAVMRGHDLLLRSDNAQERTVPQIITRTAAVEWAALNFKSVYSFQDSLVTPAEAVALAASRGCKAVALTDPNLHGAIEFYAAAREAGIKPIVAAEIKVGPLPLLAYVRDGTGYKNLCSLLSMGEVTPDDFQDRKDGLLIRPPSFLPETRHGSPADARMYDILQSMRCLGLTGKEHPKKRVGDFSFPSAARLSGFLNEASDSLHIADSCGFEHALGGLNFPRFNPPDGSRPSDFLGRLAFDGARKLYGKGGAIPGNVASQLREELGIISEVGYADYFLLVWDILADCAKHGVEWLTRGSAADSLVCRCIGISSVDPIRFELYFKRFLNRERMTQSKLPDIDLDFPHDRKDFVTELIFEKYGDHAAVVGGFDTFQARSAFADIAKTMGAAESHVRRMTERLPRVSAARVEESAMNSMECSDATFSEEPFRTALSLAARLDGFPRHRKTHPCGVVLSRAPVMEMCPLFDSAGGWKTTQFDMDAVEDVGLVKLDVLGQAGLTVMRDAKKLLGERGVNVDLRGLEPWKDERVWQMVSKGDCRGVHHIESPAMCSLQRMSNCSDIDTLVAVVSVIRPGAANSLRKKSFSLRAQGLEEPVYPHPSLEPILRTTFGVVAYEEHPIQICEAFAGMDAGRGDLLRRALGKGKTDVVEGFFGEFSGSAKRLGRSDSEIRAVWGLVTGFSGYAFCRAHSTTYAVQAFEAAWLKDRYPGEFLCAVLTSGKGFYSRLVYSIECRRLGFSFLLPCVNASRATAYFLEGKSIRVPLSQVKGLSAATLERWERAKPFASVRDFRSRAAPSRAEMDALRLAGGFDGFGDSRVSQAWEIRAITQAPLFSSAELPLETPRVFPDGVELSEPDLRRRLAEELDILGFPVSGHPLELYPDVAWETYCPISRLSEFPSQTVSVCGLVIEDRLHRQDDGRNMKFLTLCDPSGIVECEMFASAYARHGLATIRHPVLEATGVVCPYESGKGLSLSLSRVTAPRKRPPLAGEPSSR